jgi:hypothetical protein
MSGLLELYNTHARHFIGKHSPLISVSNTRKSKNLHGEKRIEEKSRFSQLPRDWKTALSGL